LQDANELINYRKSLNGNIGFVPTMGALHQGHISLVKESIKNNEKTIVSIFVNPRQFLAGEDFTSYPSRHQADIKICSLAGVDALFMPHIDDMYFTTEPALAAPMREGYILEGYKRPGHFDGVLQIVLKLLNITKPTHAYFGKKDAQQLFLINNMVTTLFIDTLIVPCDIVRDENGLALSSRNAYLSDEEKQKALSISRSLQSASHDIIRKEFDAEVIKKKMLDVMSEIEVEYIEITDRKFNKLKTIEIKNSMILVAAKVGTTRLIDNIWI
jgi:pantoate--beta-alanine ligase